MLTVFPWLAACLPALQAAPADAAPQAAAAVPARPRVSFHPAERLSSADGPIALDAPGYAAPTWYDLDGDGQRDLVVGQYEGGKLKIYRQTGRNQNGLPQLAAGTWLEAGGEVAQVPGVW